MNHSKTSPNYGESSPLIHGQITKSALDQVTERLFFVWPLTEKQVEWLNTVLYKDDLFWINYWSFTHTLIGFFWGLLYLWNPTIFSIRNYLISHTIFEFWEAWAGGYFSGIRKLTVPEIIDGVMDTFFGLAGVYLAIYLFGSRSN